MTVIVALSAQYNFSAEEAVSFLNTVNKKSRSKVKTAEPNKEVEDLFNQLLATADRNGNRCDVEVVVTNEVADVSNEIPNEVANEVANEDVKPLKKVKLDPDLAKQKQIEKDQAKQKALEEKELAKQKALEDKELAKQHALKEKELAKQKALEEKELAKQQALEAKELAKQELAKQKEVKTIKVPKAVSDKKEKATKEVADEEPKEVIVAAIVAVEEPKKVVKEKVVKEKVVKEKVVKEPKEKVVKEPKEKASKEKNVIKNDKKDSKEEADEAPVKVTVTRIKIGDQEYLKSAANILYNPETKEEVGLYDVDSNSIKALPDDDEEELEEDTYESECE